MKKIIVVLVFSLFVINHSAWAMQPAVIGGLRDGLAVGIMADQHAAQNVEIRYGIEACTGKQPIILFVGGRFYLLSIQERYPLSLGIGAIGYFGEKSNAGVSLSFIFDRVFDIKPLFIETGIDIVGSGRFMLQVGYKF